MAARNLNLLNINLRAIRRSKNYRRNINPLEEYTERELRDRYRFTSAGIQFIVDLLRDDISPSTKRSHSVSALYQVLITLRFLATGTFLQVVGDTFYGFDKGTVCRVVRRVTLALASKMHEFIKFPQSNDEKNEVKKGLYEIAKFPCAIGCVDGTHIAIKSPKDNESDFVNRKGYHSINVQGICNHQGE